MDWKLKLLTSVMGGIHGVKDNIVLPLLGRLGTTTATVLVAANADNELSNQVATGVVAFGLILFDLLVDRMGRKEAARKGKI